MSPCSARVCRGVERRLTFAWAHRLPGVRLGRTAGYAGWGRVNHFGPRALAPESLATGQAPVRAGHGGFPNVVHAQAPGFLMDHLLPLGRSSFED
jgi:hypothetical protein